MWGYFNVPEAEYLGYMRSAEEETGLKVRLRMANGEVFEHEGTITAIEGDKLDISFEKAGFFRGRYFVLGGLHSANTRRLADLCKKYNEATFHLQNWDELDKNVLF